MNPQLINPTNNTIATPMENVTAEQYNEAFKKGFTPLRPDVSRSPTVTTDMFNSSPLTLPDMRTNRTFNTPTVGIPMGVTTDASGYAVYTPPQTSANDKILGSLEKIGVDLAQKPEVTRRLQEEQQLAQKTQQATIDYNNYQAAKLALQQQVEDVYKQGKTVEGADAAVRELTRVGNANLANLAVIAQASQGLLSAAEKTIKDKIDAQFSPLMEQADYWAKVATVRNNDLTEKERFRLTEISNQKKTEVASVMNTAESVQSILSKNSAPVSSYDSVDRIIEDYRNGSITATQATSKMYQIAGVKTDDSSPSVLIDILQKNIDAGYSPEEAAREAGAYLDMIGIPMSKKELEKLLLEARTLKKTPPATPASITSSDILTKPQSSMQPVQLFGSDAQARVRELTNASNTKNDYFNRIQQPLDTTTVTSFFNNLFGG